MGSANKMSLNALSSLRLLRNVSELASGFPKRNLFLTLLLHAQQVVDALDKHF